VQEVQEVLEMTVRGYFFVTGQSALSAHHASGLVWVKLVPGCLSLGATAWDADAFGECFETLTAEQLGYACHSVTDSRVFRLPE
jgi:hypothetical protein